MAAVHGVRVFGAGPDDGQLEADLEWSGESERGRGKKFANRFGSYLGLPTGVDSPYIIRDDSKMGVSLLDWQPECDAS